MQDNYKVELRLCIAKTTTPWNQIKYICPSRDTATPKAVRYPIIAIFNEMLLVELWYAQTSWNELEDAAETGVVRLDGVGVQFEDKVVKRRVMTSSDHRQAAANFVVPDTLLVHLRSFQVQVELEPICTPVVNNRPMPFVQPRCASGSFIGLQATKSHMHIVQKSNYLRQSRTNETMLCIAWHQNSKLSETTQHNCVNAVSLLRIICCEVTKQKCAGELLLKNYWNVYETYIQKLQLIAYPSQ